MEVADAVYEFSSTEAGKRVLILGGTHGNEETGVAVVRLLQEELAVSGIASGTVRLAIGNPRAVTEGRRFSSGGTDLNKLFREGVLGAAAASYEAERAQLLARYIRDSDIVIDIHSTQQQTATAFISSKIDEAHEAVYAWFGALAPIVIEDPQYVFAGEPASVDEYADVIGKVGICFETGYATDTSKTQEVAHAMRQMLIASGNLKGVAERIPASFARYRWEESIPYDAALGWEWAPGITVRSFEYIPNDTVFGYAGGEPVSRPYDSYLLFPKTRELMESEGRVGYLAVRLPAV